MRIVVIGTGGAGVSAVEAIREYDKDSEIFMISRENTPPYSPCVLVDYFQRKEEIDKLFWKGEDFYKKMDVTPLLGKVVNKINTKNKKISFNEETLDYDKLLIAAGGKVTLPPLKGLNKKGVFTFKTLEDADKIREWIKKGKVEKGVVIGGGFIGLDAAMCLTSYGVKVTVVEALNRLLPRMLDYEMGTLVKEIVERNGVAVVVNGRVNEIVGEEKVEKVKFEKGEVLDAEIVVMATGVKPNTEVVEGTDIKFNGRRGVVVNEYMETSVKDVYAAGDIVESIDIVTGEKKPILLWSNALLQGAIAGYNLIGRKVKYLGSTNQTIIKVFNVPVVSDGNYIGEEIKLFSRDVYKKMYIKNNRIYGYMLINTKKNAGLYNSLMVSKKDISEFKDFLLTDEFNYGKLVTKAITLEKETYQY